MSILPLKEKLSPLFMPRLQRYLTKDKDVSGNKAEYYNYRITVPADIANAAHITEGQILYARLVRKRITMHQKPQPDSKPMRARLRMTRYYNAMPCYVTEVILPIEFVRELNLQKGQELDFDIHDNIITISK